LTGHFAKNLQKQRGHLKGRQSSNTIEDLMGCRVADVQLANLTEQEYASSSPLLFAHSGFTSQHRTFLLLKKKFTISTFFA
jgi:hypothetical protein